MWRSRLTDRRGPFSAKGFLPLWLSGLCWHWSRWAIAFLAGYHVNVVTGSPRLVQLTGTVMWAPLLLGGALGGVISDRFDRRRTVRWQTALLIPLAVIVGLAERAGQLGLWLLYPFLLFAGVGWVVDMTSRRALLLDIVGQQRIGGAMAWETMALASGLAAGQLLGGVITGRAGVGTAFLGIGGVLCVALVLLMWVPKVPRVTAEESRSSVGAEMRAGLRLARTNRGLLSILGVTVMANFFMFAYFPAVQLIGKEVDATASQIGLIGSMTGFGMITSSFITSVASARRWGILYVSGVFVTMAMLIVWALSPNVPFAVVTLYLASCGSGLFAATQSTLVLTVVPEQMRGRAMGLLSMAIGALPIGTYLLGEVAQALGPRTAVIVMASLGFVALTLWLVCRPEVVRRRHPAR
ncbi:MAG: MFS transporter [Acidimicrobiales bacterium]|nr:MFS transporter [Acidimicrobiales bacterium]MYD82955.1 MFS transporter [Acidimicrobiales bacterium]MYJ65632.1 MFS transporter [Acidimicrobiales bacterium]